MSTLFTLIRHGETEWNAESRMQGHLDSPLTDQGIGQAKATSQALRATDFDAIYASPLGRARHTAEIITAAIKGRIEYKDDLKERNLGVMQGFSVVQLKEEMPEILKRALSDPDYTVPEGESSKERADRGNRCMQSLADRHPDGRVLVVTHGGIIDGVFRRLFSIPLQSRRGFSLFNCAVNIIEIEAETWRLRTWGDIHHLHGLGVLDDE